ncbi:MULTISPECIES: signal peptide peptidase SppA [Gammaproteobacteria]|uniref:signal peptide peptidase SppA n=1 Tax=Gammaproteobacteria TaxID=1236 RepID=UPI000DD0A1DF|nr:MULTISPECIES: signal peptide peptidase SppA [Gammaproteobacteria]RTE87095.1 signal peptide peptidase SppA [Aliidiomarina sp. B3213]TCZ93116.1 signal peptide peptidase SppA [Lysobacter sp. N42]
MKFLASIFGKLGTILSNLRRYVAHILTVLVIIFVVSAIFSPSEEPEVPEGAMLVLAPKGTLVEFRVSEDPIQKAIEEALGNAAPPAESLYELITTLEQASQDDRISGLVLELSQFSGAGLNKVTLLAEAIQEFKASGKPVYAMGSNYSQSQYLLASQADHVFLNPLGGAMLEGFRSERPYFAELLEKLKVKVNVFRVGDYKSAVEPYLLSEMSDEARENLSGWLNEQWQQYLVTVQDAREISDRMVSGNFEDFLAELEAADMDMAMAALNTGMVDELLHREEMRERIIEVAGRDDEHHSFVQISHRTYWQTLPDSVTNQNFESNGSDQQVAIIFAKGTIVDGSGLPTEVGGDRLASELRDARFDDNVKAVVLRVDSPGGSAFASEVIRQELLNLREAGKPVIASMSSVAASGGYWISAGADEIIAAPSTITGSIGVFGLIPTIDETLAEVGINFDGVSTTNYPAFSQTQPITPELGAVVQASIDAIYDDFLDLVGEARGMTRDEVHAVAQGQVWSGERALELGLVDTLGTLADAVARAGELAGLESPKAKWPSYEPSFMQQLFADLGLGQSHAAMPEVMGQMREAYLIFNQFNDPRGAYVRCIECE